MIRPSAEPGLLVSVRSADEARVALAGGADLIDVKEPRGSLGRADVDVIESVITEVGGRVPISAALGEWTSWTTAAIPPGLTYVKWGLSGQFESRRAGRRRRFAMRSTPPCPSWPRMSITIAPKAPIPPLL